ncbi:MAG TPA: hypothetical protein VNO33_21820, partial [Kofleriaceae bacterium]|nr:hypothetical protein [Kofleriaceae bacterium]
VFDSCLNEMADEGRPATSLRSVTERLERMGPAAIERYGRYLNERKIRSACQRAARLDVGARRLLFHDGVPIDIDVLLGRSPVGAPPEGKTRISVIYLNTLEAQEDKDFVVATIADRMVSWMLQNPSPDLQALFYIDEVAPFMPPVRKPACKEDLQVLFKQARKFGVGCVVATQNPGDVDYKAMGQFGTWALGRLATRQDLKKVEPAVRSLMPGATPILEEVPSLRPGELVLLSPDNFDEPAQLATRWLHSEHRTLEEEAIDALAGPWRERLGALERGSRGRPRSPIEMDETVAAPMSAEESGRHAEPPPEPPRGRRQRPPAHSDLDSEPTMSWVRGEKPADGARAPARRAPRKPAPRKRERAAARPRPAAPVRERRLSQSQAPAPDAGRLPRARPIDAAAPSRSEREAARDPDPSWAWPRDPDLAWIRSRNTEPAWAPSERPPSATAPPAQPREDDRAGEGRARGDRARKPAPAPEPDSDSGSDAVARIIEEADPKLQRFLAVLGGKLSMTGPEFAERAGISERTARAKLKALVASGHAGEYREERTARYWSRVTGARPDLGMKASVLSVQPRVDHGSAEEIGRSLVKSKMLGILGGGESFAQARLVYRLVYRVAFEEKVKRPLLGRIIGPSHEERLGSLYLHPCTLDVLLFSNEAGLRFATRLPDHASEVDDLDGVVTFLEVRPGDITFDEEEWSARVAPALAKKRLRETFRARPGAVTPVFVPLWKLLLRRNTGSSYRVETIDALAGRPVDWPELG